MTTYPYIKYPTEVVSYLNGEFPDLSKLALPSKKKLRKLDNTGYLITISCIIIIVSLVNLGVTIWLAYVGLIILAYLSFSLSYTRNKNLKQENITINNSYQEELISIQIENDKREKLKNALLEKKQLEEFKKRKIKEILRKYEHPELISSATKKGLSESFFIRFLFKYFGNNIRPFTKLYRDSFSYDYQPDFVFQNDNICIDIEIDEPYDMESRTAIHCSDELSNKKRDEFFISHNWCVIRFTEEQALLYPYECCKCIAHAISVLTDDNKFLKDLSFRRFPAKTNSWTKSEAEKMAIDRHRELLFSKAHHNASQLDYFPHNFFDDDGIILLTKVSKGANNEHVCLNNNFHGPKKLFIANHFFPNLKCGDTIELNLKKFVLEESFLKYSLPTSTDPLSLDFEEYKELVTRINRLRK